MEDSFRHFGGVYFIMNDLVDLVDSANAVSTMEQEDDPESGLGVGAEQDPEEDPEDQAWARNAHQIARQIQSQFEADAKRVAAKVRAQQEGRESAMLGAEHADHEFQTVDDIKRMLEGQMASNASTSQPRSNPRRFSRGISGSSLSKAAVSDPQVALKLGEWFLTRSRSIPLRLAYEERKHLRLVKAVMKGNSYTQKVDGKKHKSKARCTQAKMKAVQAVIVGMITALNCEAGQQLIAERDFARFRKAIQALFEIGRRYKIMNPDRMRGEYGKMMYMLQDTVQEDVLESLGFSCVVPVKTVYDILEAGDGLAVLQDPYVCTATAEILPVNEDGTARSRAQIQREIKLKENAKKYLSRHYSNSALDSDTIELCLNSICDNNNFLNANRAPIDRMLAHLHDYFHPDKFAQNLGDERRSLAIGGGRTFSGGSASSGATDGVGIAEGADETSSGTRLSHSHEKQFMYVYQSLTLWREIVQDLFRLWWLAESDLLDSEVKYEMRDTGQGEQRVQPCNRISKAMHGILYAVQQKSNQNQHGWVGSSVIHLGDSNVPNALLFIDKYNQVSRILNPIDQCLRHVDIFYKKDKGLRKYIDATWGNAAGAKMAILRDFFRFGFDGSGADNFFEAGSCIDGRLTSAWNWCQALPDKPFYPLFKLSGFLGFDGEFQH